MSVHATLCTAKCSSLSSAEHSSAIKLDHPVWLLPSSCHQAPIAAIKLRLLPSSWTIRSGCCCLHIPA